MKSIATGGFLKCISKAIIFFTPVSSFLYSSLSLSRNYFFAIPDNTKLLCVLVWNIKINCIK